jgi:glycosyltransferase involved in cell wall biosynthesis
LIASLSGIVVNVKTVAVNALSIGSMSGRHVLFGHLRQLAGWTVNTCEFVVISNAGEEQPADLKLPNVRWTHAPRSVRHWTARTLWEATELPRSLKRMGADLYFTPNGTTLPRCSVRQLSLAQNPWPLVRTIHRTASERFKAKIQRAAYRRARRSDATMAFNSNHMQEQYAENAGGITGGPSVIAYQGIGDDTHELAAVARRSELRRPLSILAVSAMAHWKGAETAVAAVAMLRKRGLDAALRLVGPWPDAGYEQKVRQEIEQNQVADVVTITGPVSREQLHREYATAKVFCLMSRCESFGIPAVEAQAFGTPVLGTTTTAMAEIGGAGGLFGLPDDARWVAEQMEGLLGDEAEWRRFSEAAIANANRYRWDECSRPLLAAITGGESAMPTESFQGSGRSQHRDTEVAQRKH